MKNVYLLAAGLLMAASVTHAQIGAENNFSPISKSSPDRPVGYANDREPGDVIIEDDFSNEANWMIYHEDGTTPDWDIITVADPQLDDYVAEMASPTAANGYGAFNGIQYLLAGTVVPINSLIEYADPINCTDATGVTLEFYFCYRAFNSDEVFVEVTDDDWDTFEAIEIYPEMPPNPGTATQRINLIDISAVAATKPNVRVRFRFIELGADPLFGAGYGAMVDDFKVKEAWDYDQNITASYHRSGIGVSNENGLEYHMIPESQTTDIFFAGKKQNMGGMIQPNAKLNADVTGPETYSGTSTPTDLPIGETDSVACEAPFSPTTVGTYDVTFWADCDEVEQETMNDTIYNSFQIMPLTNAVYARDNGIASGAISNVTSNTSQPLLIGNTMDIFADDLIGAVDIRVSNAATNVDQLIFAQIMVFDEGAGAYVYLGQTEDHIITSGENGGMIRLFLEDPIDVFEGQTIIVLAGHYGGTDEVEFRMAQSTDEQTVLGYISGATEPFFLTAPSAIMIRAVLMDFTGIEDAVSNSFSIGQNMPNPFNDNSLITYELNEAANVTVEIVDVTGKIVKTINQGTQPAGMYTITLDAHDFAEGVYYYTFKVGSAQLTKSMVITK